ncbi:MULTISPECIES: hypothetical protein [unclassified Kitasatospora]|uniref:hypothetical protein n=1 Tax=unclassified Kitasatospora TaxID=2633591 RepID=UPI003408C774
MNWALAAEAESAEAESAEAESAEAASGTAAEAAAGAPTAVLPAQAGAVGGAGAEAERAPKNAPENAPMNASENAPKAGAQAGKPAVTPAAPPVPAPASAASVAAPAVAAPSAAGTPEALAAAVVGESSTESGTDPGPRPGRVSRPMIAAAVAVGLVLVGTSVVVTQLGGNDPKHGPAQADAPPGYGQGGGDGGSGFVPGYDEHGGVGGGSPAPDGQPGAVVPPVDAGSVPLATGDQPASAPNGTGGGGGSGVAAQPGGAANPVGTGGSATGGGGPAQGGSGPAPAGGGAGAAKPAPQQPVPNQPAPNQPPANQPAPPPAGAQNPAPPPVAKQPAPVTAVAGPYCGNYRTYGWYDDGDKGWRNNSGGYSGDGCNGTYASMPMSGDANDDKSNSVVWTFSLDKVTSCTLAVYIPASSNVKQVGGNPSYYTVQSGGGSVGSFTINQTASLGSWVTKGPFPYRGPISLTLHSRGVDWSSGAKLAHHAASAVRATCTP